MDPVVITVFALVYGGMILGEFPGLRLDRSAMALLGAIVIVATGRLSLDAAWSAIDAPTITLLFSLMVISAQFRLAGFYAAVTRHLGRSRHSERGLLALVILAAGGLSAILANDIVCLAMAPVLVQLCTERRLNPVPYLLALACAANVGSAGTLIGNPQNMLIGQTLQLSFAGYLVDGGVPALVGLGIVWLVIAFMFSNAWQLAATTVSVNAPPFDRWQTSKATVVTIVVIAAFLFTSWPREIVALAAAGALLISRSMPSRKLLAEVDWELLLLFIGLFVVNHALAQSGFVSGLLMASRRRGRRPDSPRRALRGDGGVVEHRLERAGGNVAAASGARSDRGPGAGALVHARRQSRDRGQHRQHHRRRPGGTAGHRDRLARACSGRSPRRHTDARVRRGMARNLALTLRFF